MNSPFAPSTFGKTTTSGFTAPAFGSTGSSLFGGNTSTSGGLFGGGMSTPVFGQTQTTQPSAFGFGTNTTSSNLFGTQQNASTSLFGGGTTSAFGANKPAFGGFGSPSTSLFGQQQQPQATTSLFGQPAAASTSGGLFGSSGGFGASTSTQPVGTPIKFIPATGTDTMVKSGVTQTINTRHHCITCMKEYESKSLEELRLEDYMLNRKGPQQQPQQSSLFGTSTQPSLFGSPASTSAGGSSLFQDKPLFGGGTSMGFGTSTGVFGSTNQQSSSLFGKPTGFGAAPAATTQSGFAFNTTTTANPFGASTQAKPFGAVTPQTNLFGGTTSQPSTFGTQPSGFGGFGAPQNQSIGLFNQNKSPFGMTTTSTGFSFGQNTPTNQTSSLFTKPAGTTGFGTFGTNTSTGTGFGTGNMFGSNQNSLFNQSTFGKTTTSGFTFGQSQPTSTGLGTGLNLGGQPSLFGGTSKPGGLFGTSTGMFGGTGSSFGTGTNFGALGSGMGTNLNLGGSTLMGGTGGITTPSQQLNMTSVHDQLLSLTSSMPFGDIPLFRNLLPVTGKTDELLKANAPKTNTGNNQLKVTPRGSTRVRPKPLTSVQPSRKALFAGLEEDNTPETVPEINLAGGKRLLIKRFSCNAVPSLNGIVSPISDSNKENDISGYLGATSTPNKEPERVAHHKARSQSFVDASTDTAADTRPANTSSTIMDDCREDDDDDDDGSPAKKDDVPSHPTGIKLTRAGYYTIPSLDELVNFMTEDGRCLVDNFTIGREGYGNVYFPESFDVAGLDLDEIVHFRNKEVVIYPDDAERPPIGEGLNRKAQVTLDRAWPIDKTTHYPIKDPERLAEMKYEDRLRRACAKLQTRFLDFRPQTGSWVFKVNHFSKYGLSDSDDDDDLPVGVAKPLKPGVPITNGIPVKPGESLKPSALQAVDQNADKQVPLMNGDLPRPQPSLIPVLLEDDHDMEEGLHRRPLTPDDSIILCDDFERIPQSPVEQIAKELGYSSHNVQLMKATFFMGEDIAYDEGYGKMDQVGDDSIMQLEYRVGDKELDEGIAVPKIATTSLGLLHTHFAREPSPLHSRSPLASQGRGGLLMTSAVVPEPIPVPVPVEQPKTVVLSQPHHVIHWEKTTAHKIKAGCIADLDLFRGCGFRVGWGPKSTLLNLTTQQAAGTQPLAASFSDVRYYINGRPVEDTSPCIVQRLMIAGGAEKSYEIPFCDTVEGHLNIELQHSDNIRTSDDECPYWMPQAGIDSLHAHYELAKILDSENNSENEPLLKYSRHVWELSVALWGNLSTLDENTDSTSHLSVMMRKNAVSEWLEYVVLPQVKHETSQILGQIGNPNNKEFHVPAVLSYLSAKNLMEACEKAQFYGDHYAVMLLAQLGGNSSVRHWLQQQLKNWQEVEADAFINSERLKLMMLVAGIPLFSSTNGTINVCENLDWKRAFALHLWYICSPVASITDALQKYEAAFDGNDPQNVYAKCPYPPYVDESMLDDDNNRLPYDLCFHLLKLYSSRTYSLDQLLDTATHTKDKLDCRLSWLLLQMLTALGYSHVSDHAAVHLHLLFASQLESHGLWHWAIFILLHLKDPVWRKKAVLDLLERHIELSESEAYLDKEDFLIEKLQMPSQWIFGAKATLAVIQKEYSKAAWYYIKSEQFNESHEIIMAHIAANAIINENYAYLKCLLQPLVEADPENTISEWTTGGQILWDYMQIIDDVKKITSSEENFSGYQLERLQPQLSSLCSRINLLSCPTARHRLCQTEIALRITHFMRVVGQLQKRGEELSTQFLTRLLTQLPLPEDRVRDELNLIVDSVVRDLTSF